MKNNIKFREISRLGKYFRLSNNPPLFTYGKKEFLIDENKKKYIDFACGSGTTILGHNIKYLNTNIKQKINKGIVHLGPHFISPSHIEYFKELKSFFKNKFKIYNTATNGSEATEVALKLAFHHTKKKKVIYFEGSYHGRTGYSLLSSDMKGINKKYFHNRDFIKCKFNNIKEFKSKFNYHKKDLAAVIIEPIQATSGFNFSNKKFLHFISSCLKRNSTLLIFDETWTGFGKTGKDFAYLYYKILPDILILGKSIGGGLPLGLIAFNKNINHNHPGAQSSTFQGNIISINTSYFFLKYLRKIKYLKKVKKISNFFKKRKKLMLSYKFVTNFSGIGSMWGIEINNNYLNKIDFTNEIRKKLLTKGLITWECGRNGNIIGLVPPLCVTKKTLLKSIAIIQETFDVIKKKLPGSFNNYF